MSRVIASAPSFERRMARVARHLAVRGFQLRRSAAGWRIEARKSKPPAHGCHRRDGPSGRRFA